jgi:homoserine O-acetyltransferase
VTAKRAIHLVQGTARVSGAEGFKLDNGAVLPVADVRYAVFGEPNEQFDNVVLVCHALSGNSRVDQWWPVLLDGIFDLERDCVICTSVTGSCYGSTGPLSTDPSTGHPYGSTFPTVTVRDMVRAQALALEQLGISHLRAVIGSSLGGMQALQWATDFPERVGAAIAIGASPLNALGLGLNHIQRQVLALGNGDARALAIVRQIGMCTYKSSELFDERHGRRVNRTGPAPWENDSGLFDVAGYLDHQGEKFVNRFDADAYAVLTRAMDNFDPAREYGTAELAWQRITAKVLLFGISSDWLFPASDVRSLADSLSGAGVDCQYHELVSDHGHDAFLAEPEKLLPVLTSFLERLTPRDAALPAFAGSETQNNAVDC